MSQVKVCDRPRQQIQIPGQGGGEERECDSDALVGEGVDRSRRVNRERRLRHRGGVGRRGPHDAERLAVYADERVQRMRPACPVHGRRIGQAVGRRPDREIGIHSHQRHGGRPKRGRSGRGLRLGCGSHDHEEHDQNQKCVEPDAIEHGLPRRGETCPCYTHRVDAQQLDRARVGYLSLLAVTAQFVQSSSPPDPANTTLAGHPDFVGTTAVARARNPGAQNCVQRPCCCQACAGQYAQEATRGRRSPVVRGAGSSEPGHLPVGCSARQGV